MTLTFILFRSVEPERRRSARFRRRSLSSCDLSNLHDGKEIYEALTQASDPDAFKVGVDITLAHTRGIL